MHGMDEKQLRAISARAKGVFPRGAWDGDEADRALEPVTKDIPALIREVPDTAALAMALIENIQREDLNPIEEAVGIQRLVDEFKMTHELAADAVGRSRSATTNLLRLLKLAKPVPIFITYFTAWPDDTGRIRYFADLYGRDETMEKALSTINLAQR